MTSKKPTLMDGAMGTLLIKRGHDPRCLETLNLTEPALIREIHESYIKAGAETLTTHTFASHRLNLEGHHRLSEILRAGVANAKSVAQGRPVFASVGPIFKDGIVPSKEILGELFEEKIAYLEEEKPDAYLIETMISQEQAMAALTAARKISRSPIFVLMTPSEKNPDFPALRKAGAHVIGFNCDCPENLLPLLQKLSEKDRGPLCVRPSAGLPGAYLMATDFSRRIRPLRPFVGWIGGCCGTTPAHILALQKDLP